MSAFYDSNITDKGKLLMSDIQMGAKFQPTRIVIGSGYLPTGKTTKTITSVVQPVKELGINKKRKLPTGEGIFGAVFTNEEITEAFYYRELALYAKAVYDDDTSTDEVLYAYGNAGVNAELIPAYNTGSIIERQLDIITYIGNDTKISLTITSGTYVDIPTFEDTVNELNTEDSNLRNEIVLIQGVIENKADKSEINRLESQKAPKSHSSATTEYGAATTTQYGHTKLYSGVDSDSESLAATPKAVKTVKLSLSSKADKVSGGKAGNIAVLTSDGGVADGELKFTIVNGGLRIIYDDGE